MRCTALKKASNQSRFSTSLLCLSWLMLLLSNTSHAEIQSQAFSGLNHFIPTHARLPVYKLKAQRSRVRTRASELANQPPWGNTGTNGYGSFGFGGAPGLETAAANCSLNIGNITPGQGAASFGDKETIVFIEGDVINASNCSR